jgi:hypothetical protein
LPAYQLFTSHHPSRARCIFALIATGKDAIPGHSGLKRGDALSLLLFNCFLKLMLNGVNQAFVYDIRLDFFWAT